MDPYILIDGQIAGGSNETAPPSHPCVGCVGVWPAETPSQVSNDGRFLEGLR